MLDNEGNNLNHDESGLKQRITELEDRVAELEAELSRKPPFFRKPLDWRGMLKPLLLLVGTLLLAWLPAFFVVQSRWLGNQAYEQFFQNYWCKFGFLCRSAFPAYFLVIFPGLIGLPILIALQKNGGQLFSNLLPSQQGEHEPGNLSQSQVRAGRLCLWGSCAVLLILGLASLLSHKLPDGCFALAFLVYLLGWFLVEIPLQPLKEAWRQNWSWLVSLLLVFTCLVLLLASLYAVPEFQWIYVILLLLALVVLRQNHRKVRPIGWIIALALILYSINTNAWWLSAIGDEYSFFVQARVILQEQNLSRISEQLFIGQVVNGTHPYFSSLIQAFFMRLFGINGFAWRFSNAFLCAAAVAFFYKFFKLLVPERAALIASFFLAASHYVMSFGKIGYNNLQSLFGMSLVLATAAWGIRTKRSIAFTLLGAALGLCFYLYPASLYIVPLPFLLFLFYHPPTSKKALFHWGLVVGSLFILVFPLLLQPEFWETKVSGTFFNNPQLVQSIPVLVKHVAKNFFYAFFSFLYITSEGHFVTASYVDPLTALLVCIGLAYLITRLFRERASRFLLLSLVILVLLVGASHDRDFPPNTRMFLLLPWWMLFASLGLTWLLERLQGLGLTPTYWKSIVAGAILTVIALNVYQANTLDRDRMAGLQNLENLFLRIVQSAQKDEDKFPKTYLFITDPSWTSKGIELITRTYPVQAQITEVVIKGDDLSEPAKGLIYQRSSLVIIKPWLDPQLMAYYEKSLRELGKSPCDIKATNGDKRFVLWYSPETAWLCR